eukprot:TRINITY_DN5807_c0_g2_i1.p1 TRINITY_DN5807_c0_g2~~TRINITY_DN5807_c0_g2_i1.p1  ORF type:complete len:239 (-),score=55.15 TRINITY_DN5807_c0_g2_i1:8-724(-)
MQSSKNVIKVICSEKKSDTMYVVMEMGDRSLEEENWDPWEKKTIVQDILTAVYDVHKSGIIHGDLSPRNFVLVQGKAKLIDFGISREIEAGGMARVKVSELWGSPDFMSPQFFKALVSLGKDDYFLHGKEFDVWSVGCILFYMIFGETPYYKLGMSDQEVGQADFIDFTFPELKDGISCHPKIGELIQSTLVFDPKKRPPIRSLLDAYFLSLSSLREEDESQNIPSADGQQTFLDFFS